MATSNRRGVGRRAAIRTLAGGAMATAASVTWAASLTALARQQAHAHAAAGVIAAQDWTPRTLTAPQNDLVVALTELIIPATDTPGAKAARVNRFVDQVLTDAPPPVRAAFLRGLGWIDSRSRELYKQPFLSGSAAQQTALLTRISAEGNPDTEAAIGREFFQAIKAMTINGYYTTEIGLRQELGDSGQLFLLQFQGCDHPEHQ